MDILVCIKRVPTVGGKIAVTPDGQEVDTRASGFSISPHEECAVEEAVQITERDGGSVSVLTLGPEAAIEQLRGALALGAHRAVLLETDGREFGPIATAAAIAAEVRAHPYDLVLLGNEAADTGDYQVGVRLAHELGWPVATGIKNLSVSDGAVVARREYRGVEEAYSLPLPAVVTVKEGINLPRYPSLPGRLRAKRAAVDRSSPEWAAEGLRKSALRVPESGKHQAEVLGEGVDAVPGAGPRPGGMGGAVMTALVLVELDGGAPADASLRALTLARSLGDVSAVVFADAAPQDALAGLRRHRRLPDRIQLAGGVRPAGLGADAGRAGRRDRRDRRAGRGHRPGQRGAGAPRRDHRAADGGELHAGHPGRRQDAPAGPAPLGRAAARGRGHGGAGRAVHRGH